MNLRHVSIDERQRLEALLAKLDAAYTHTAAVSALLSFICDGHDDEYMSVAIRDAFEIHPHD
jgi:hypothetical protein